MTRTLWATLQLTFCSLHSYASLALPPPPASPVVYTLPVGVPQMLTASQPAMPPVYQMSAPPQAPIYSMMPQVSAPQMQYGAYLQPPGMPSPVSAPPAYATPVAQTGRAVDHREPRSEPALHERPHRVPRRRPLPQKGDWEILHPREIEPIRHPIVRDGLSHPHALNGLVNQHEADTPKIEPLDGAARAALDDFAKEYKLDDEARATMNKFMVANPEAVTELETMELKKRGTVEPAHKEDATTTQKPTEAAPTTTTEAPATEPAVAEKHREPKRKHKHHHFRHYDEANVDVPPPEKEAVEDRHSKVDDEIAAMRYRHMVAPGPYFALRVMLLYFALFAFVGLALAGSVCVGRATRAIKKPLFVK